MHSLRSPLILLTLAGVLALSWLWWARLLAPMQARAFYASALRGAHASTTVSVGGATYRITNGALVEPLSGDLELRVLSLAYARIAAERSPVLDLTGVDPDELSGAVDELTHMELLISQAQKIAMDRSAALELYPEHFLASLVPLERTRQAFIASGGESDEQAYLSALAAAAEAGVADSSALLKIESDPRDIRKQNFTAPSLGGAITPQSIYTGTQNELARMHELARTAAAQRACFMGSTAQCRSGELALPSVAALSAAPAEPVPSATLAARAAAQRILFHGRSAPLVALAKSRCMSQLAAPYYFLDESSDLGPDRPLFYSGDLYFESLDVQAYIPFIKFFKRKYGGSYLPYNPAVFYNCPETLTDYSATLATEAVAAFAIAHPQYAPEAADALHGDVIAQSDAADYLRAALRAQETQPDDAQGAIVRLALMFNDHTVGLPEIIKSVASVNARHAQDSLKGIPFDVSFVILLLAHSAMPSLYLSDNPTTGTIPVTLRTTLSNNLSLFTKQFFTLASLSPAQQADALTDTRNNYIFENGS